MLVKSFSDNSGDFCVFLLEERERKSCRFTGLDSNYNSVACVVLYNIGMDKIGMSSLPLYPMFS
jgi:hypothetical protein